MPQPMRPKQDNLVGNFTSTPLYAKVDELSADDGDYVTSGMSQGDKFEVQLTAPAIPGDGPRTLKLRLRKTDSNDLPVVVRLMQGSRIVAVRAFEPTQDFDDEVSIQLSDDEVQNITDYSNLRVQVQADFTRESCTECPDDSAPSSWLVAFPVMSSGCSECDELNPVTLTYQGNCTWSGSVTLCGNPETIELIYDSSFWHLSTPDGEYSLSDLEWDCLGVNVMGDYYGTFDSCPWPEQVVVSPA